MDIKNGIEYTKETYHKALSFLGKEKEYKEYPLELEQIIAIHDELIKDFGGSYGLRDENLLKSVQQAPYQSVFGEDLCPSIFDKAAKLLLDFCRYQVFLDGNKRTGVGACSVFLYMNEYRLTFTNEQLYHFTMDIANQRITEVSEIANVLRENSIAMIKEPQKKENMDERNETYGNERE